MPRCLRLWWQLWLYGNSHLLVSVHEFAGFEILPPLDVCQGVLEGVHSILTVIHNLRKKTKNTQVLDGSFTPWENTGKHTHLIKVIHNLKNSGNTQVLYGSFTTWENTGKHTGLIKVIHNQIKYSIKHRSYTGLSNNQGLSQDLETGCPNWQLYNFEVPLFKGGHNTFVYSAYNHYKYVFTYWSKA